MVTEQIEVDYSTEPKITVREVASELLVIPKGATLETVEKLFIIQVLETNKNNKRKTALELGISIKTLYNKLHMYGLYEKYQNQKTEGVNS
jgi:transcriptional regulator with PAS, ATPase and Fis domain